MAPVTGATTNMEDCAGTHPFLPEGKDEPTSDPKSVPALPRSEKIQTDEIRSFTHDEVKAFRGLKPRAD